MTSKYAFPVASDAFARTIPVAVPARDQIAATQRDTRIFIGRVESHTWRRLTRGDSLKQRGQNMSGHEASPLSNQLSAATWVMAITEPCTRVCNPSGPVTVAVPVEETVNCPAFA